jgi:hypothetical protein
VVELLLTEAGLWVHRGFQVYVIMSVTVMRAADAQPAVNP